MNDHQNRFLVFFEKWEQDLPANFYIIMTNFDPSRCCRWSYSKISGTMCNSIGRAILLVFGSKQISNLLHSFTVSEQSF